MTTRFAGWSGTRARMLLVGLATVILVVCALASKPIPPDEFLADDPVRRDNVLYATVVDQVAAGRPYYDVVVAEHRARGYPLRPFVTVRPPTLAIMMAASGSEIAALALRCLAAVTTLALMLRFRAGHPVLLPIVASIGIAPLITSDLTVWHEVWAGLLIALSLTLRSPGRWAASLLVGLMAVAIRELALPYLVAMAWMAFREGERKEASAWVAGVAMACLGLCLHAVAVTSHVQPDDLASPGWASFGGVRLVATMMHVTGWLSYLGLPVWSAGLALPLAMLGWSAMRTPEAERATLVLAGFMAAFLFIGRSNNVYWGFLLAPFVFVGLAVAPYALRDLLASARLRVSAGDQERIMQRG